MSRTLKPRVWYSFGEWHCGVPDDPFGPLGHGPSPAEAWHDRQRLLDEACADATWLSVIRVAYLAQFAPVGRPS